MGIYVHIPFCRSKCYYCGFYSVASLNLKEQYINALIKEINIRQDYLGNKMVSTLYFGGGTPSYLSEIDLKNIITEIYRKWKFTENAEISIELNPEDGTMEKLTSLKELGFNRLTFGVQSFDKNVLKTVNRTHAPEHVVTAIENARRVGFNNIGIDIIIGLPGATREILMSDLQKAKELNTEHISLYIFSVDPGTVFEKLYERGKISLHTDEELYEQYMYVSDFFKNCGYEHYEISNFAKNGKYSKHNTSYWQQKPYLGLGAAAHSYNIESRQWNVSNVKKYVDSLNDSNLIFEKENLNREDKFNEYIMTRLRTMWGIDIEFIQSNYSEYYQVVSKHIQKQIDIGNIIKFNSNLRLTEDAWFISDDIFSEMFV